MIDLAKHEEMRAAMKLPASGHWFYLVELPFPHLA